MLSRRAVFLILGHLETLAFLRESATRNLVATPLCATLRDMEISRRSFLSGALVLTAAAVLPSIALADVPTIYGDGIHDDWAGLQAALDGEPFRAVNDCVVVRNVGGSVRLHGGNFRLSRTLRLSSGSSISNARFRTTGDFDGFMVEYGSRLSP